jgi:heme/copper-type cytochrome/quinol oxidase subunit 1
MVLKKIKAYHLFWFVAVIILLIGFLSPNSTLDINVHDTYFVIANFDVAITLFIFYFFNGFGYWSVQKVLKKQLEKYLTLIHTSILIGSFVIYWLVLLYCKLFISNPSFPLFDESLLINLTLLYEFILIIFVALPVYIINLLIGIFKKKKMQKKYFI